MKLRRTHGNLGCLLIAIASLAIAPAGIRATTIPLGGGGVLVTTNEVGTLVGISNACINWNSAVACTNPPGAIQVMVAGADAAVFTPGTTALDTIKSIPAGVVTPLVDFKTAQSPLAGGVVHFDLIGLIVPAILPGNNCATFALSAVCNPGGGSPFTFLQQSANQIAVSFSTMEEAYTGTSGVNYNAATPYTGAFFFQISGVLPNGQTDTIPNLLAFIGGGGTLETPWSSTDSPNTAADARAPEPMSALLLSSGLACLAVFRRGRARRTLRR